MDLPDDDGAAVVALVEVAELTVDTEELLLEKDGIVCCIRLVCSLDSVALLCFVVCKVVWIDIYVL